VRIDTPFTTVHKKAALYRRKTVEVLRMFRVSFCINSQ